MSEAGGIVERYYHEAGKSDAAAARDLVANQAVLDELDAFRRAFPDASIQTDLLVEAGNLVGVHLRGNGTHLGVFQGHPPTGRRWAATCSAFFLVEQGRIADAWINWDLLGILEQLGAIRREPQVSPASLS
jgi:predicted ester cyclase